MIITTQMQHLSFLLLSYYFNVSIVGLVLISYSILLNWFLADGVLYAEGECRSMYPPRRWLRLSSVT